MIEIDKKSEDKVQKRIKELAKRAWAKTCKNFYYPPLNEPLYIFDYTRKEGFYIDPKHWQITMNLANTPPFTENKEYFNYFHAITLHEVSHYQIIPYDGLLNAKLLRMAIKHVNQIFAPIVVNIFSDLIIDTKLFQDYPDLMKWEIETTYNYVIQGNKNQLSKFSMFLFKAYEKIFNINFIGSELYPELDLLVDKIIKIISKDFEDETKWEQKVSKVAYHLRGLINETFTLISPGVSTSKGKRRKKTDESIIIELPEDILELMDNPFENKNSDKLNRDNIDGLNVKAEEFAKNVPYSEFGAPASQAGILIDGNSLATWYRGIAKDLINIKIFEKRPSGKVPIYPETWRIGDPMEQLDVPLSLSNYPVMIPNITTKKWVLEEGSGMMVEKQLPDILIVLDSSGSMRWNIKGKTDNARGQYHTAIIASFAALHQAASKGVKFSIINFSNHPDICQWTRNIYEAENTILRYQGGGTVLPIKGMVDQCNKAEKKVLVLLITDFGLYNWEKSKKKFLELANKGHFIIGFFIGAQKIPKSKFKTLLDKVKFYPIKNIKKLIDLVIENVNEHFSI
ncbi:MAG: hypothetical protein ACFFBP_11505 [Promethearchaeota archaeon]